MEDNDEEQADTVEQVFDLDYDVDQAFCSHSLPKAVLLFTGEALNDVMDFESEDGERDDDDDDDDNDEGGDDEGGGMGSPFPASAKTTVE